MLARLSIRDIILIDRLDIDFGSGLAALTGETGAGKSILLDAFALALGARGEAALVRHGAEQGQVIAAFEVAKGHPARRVLAANDLVVDADDELIVRRVQFADGRTRAFVNDQPVSVQVLRALGAALVEIHGQHDERAFVEAATHRALVDAFGGLEDDAAEVSRLWHEHRARKAAVEAHRAEVERAQREAEWLRHAVDELRRLAPETGEETALAERRAAMMQAEKVAEDLRATHEAISGPQSPVPPLATAVRRLERRAALAPALIARFEAQVLAECGFSLDLERCAATGAREDLIYVSPKSGRAVSAAAGERAKGARSNAFGVITTSGRRTGRFAWARSRWKYCAAAVGWATVMFWPAARVRNRSRRAEECSGPWPSKPWGSSSTRPEAWPHFSSAATRKLSMMIWAPLAKSPNCASQTTRASAASTE